MLSATVLLAFANRLADTSRSILLESPAASVPFKTKNDLSPVTEVDQRVERALRERIAGRYPEHGILGEEYAGDKTDAEYVWIIDPIDGTKAFLAGIPVYGTLIALARKGTPVIGIIDHPVTRERWAGMDGTPSTYNGRPIRCRSCATPADAIIATSNPEPFNQKEKAAFSALRQQAKWGIYGGSCYAYGRLATGNIDLCLDCGLDPFDYCALDVVIRGAGGCMTDWEGNRLTIRSGHRVVASGDERLHRHALATIAAALS